MVSRSGVSRQLTKLGQRSSSVKGRIQNRPRRFQPLLDTHASTLLVGVTFHHMCWEKDTQCVKCRGLELRSRGLSRLPKALSKPWTQSRRPANILFIRHLVLGTNSSLASGSPRWFLLPATLAAPPSTAGEDKEKRYRCKHGSRVRRVQVPHRAFCDGKTSGG